MCICSPHRLRLFFLILLLSSSFGISAQSDPWERISVLGERNLRSSDLIDLDGDGDLDILCRHIESTGKLAWYINDGLGNYSTGQEINTGPDNVDAYSMIDFDGDEDLDIIITNENITWLENLGNGNFANFPNLLIADHSIDGQHVADFDNDGDLDIVGQTPGNNPDLVWYENQGANSFAPLSIMLEDLSSLTGTFRLGDLNNDGYVDILTTVYHDIIWFENQGNGQFLEEVSIGGSGTSIYDMEIVDINMDGNLDILCGSTFDDFSWIRNLGNGNFSFQIGITTDELIGVDVEAEDIDGDGDIDVLMSDRDNDRLLWYEHLEGGGFSQPIVISDVSGSYSQFECGDIDGDGDIDVLNRNSSLDKLSWFENDGDGVFSLEKVFSSAYPEINSALPIDLDGDGDLDIIAGNYTTGVGKLAYIENNGTNDYLPQQILTEAGQWGSVYTDSGDLDGDGDLDIVAASINIGELSWFENLGDGTLSAKIVLTTDLEGPKNTTLVDLDNDGDLDIVLNNDASLWFENNGDATFSERSGTGISSGGYHIADLDNDGDIDIITTSWSWDRVSWRENLGGGAFTDHVISESVENPQSVFAADFDLDGDIDIAVNKYYGGTSILTNNGDGNFDLPVDLSESIYFPKTLTGTDYDLDGDIDLISVSGDNVLLIENIGEGNFANSQIIVSQSDTPTSIVMADIDNDGKNDLLAATREQGDVAWYINPSGEGCTNPEAINYNPEAVEDNGTCCFITGCTNPIGTNYNVDAQCDDGSCEFITGCTNPIGTNYNPDAYLDDDSCVFSCSGIVFVDEDENGVWNDNDQEYPLSLQEIILQPLGWTVWTNDEGEFTFNNIPEGSYQLEVIHSIQLPYSTTPNPVAFNTSSLNNEIVMGVSKEFLTFGICVDFYPLGNGYPCNDWANHNICYRNMGNVPISGIVEVEFNPLFQDYTEATPIDSVADNIIYMSFENLLPNQMFFYDVLLLTPTVDYIGDFITSTTRIYGFHDGNQVAYGEKELTVEMTCSYDPNDKQVFPNGYAEPHFILNGTELEYLVRFQNTGNASATNVLVTDTIDSNLDLETFVIMANSHSVQTTLKPELRVIEFLFENIMLPDSNSNEPESHGLISFKISPYEELSPGTELNNTGNIYFDNNPPIITNTTWNTIYECTNELANIEEFDSEICVDEEVELLNSNEYIEEYLWTSNDEILGNDSALVSQLPLGSDEVTLMVSNPLCEANNSFAFDILVSPELETSGDQAICDGEESTVSATSNVELIWEDFDNNSEHVVSPSETSSYYVSATNDNGCTSSEEITITVNPVPTPVAGEDLEICLGENAILTASDGENYQWTGFDQGESIDVSPEENTAYEVITINEFNCQGSDEVLITVNPLPTPNAGQNIEICLGENIILTASEGENYQWTGFDPGESIAVSPEEDTAYEVIAINEFNCQGSDEVVVQVNPLPTPNAGEDLSICLGEEITLTATEAANYQWTGFDPGESIDVSPQEDSTYEVIAINEFNCQGSDEVTVQVNPIPNSEFSANGIVLTANAGDSYQWFLNTVPISDATGQTFFIEEDGNYSVEITNEWDCSATSEEQFFNFVGIDETSLNLELEIFPNPATEEVRITLPFNSGTARLFDASGKLIKSFVVQNDIVNLSVASLSEGVYHISVVSNNGTVVSGRLLVIK